MAAARRLQEYVDEYRWREPEEFWRRYRAPVLIRQDLDSEDPGGQFDTSLLDESQLATSSGTATIDDLRRLADDDAGPIEEVYFVRKRPKGAFPNQIGVGRAPNVDMPVHLPRISKYHAFFSSDEEGRHYLTDAGSKNGTRVNDQLLEPRRAYELTDGATIQLGPYTFRFHTPDGFQQVLETRAKRRDTGASAT